MKKEFNFSPFSDLIVFGCSKLSGGAKRPVYFGKRYSLVIPLSGRVDIELEEDGRKFSVPSGKAALISPYVICDVKYAEEYFSVWFDGEIAERAVNIAEGVSVFSVGSITLLQIADFNSFDGDEFSSLLKVSSIVLSALSYAENTEKEKLGGSGNKIVDKFISYVEGNYDRDFKTADVCSEFGLTLSALNHTVKRVLGVSPHRFLIATRMKKAKELLRNTDMSVESISYLVGYEYSGHFCNEFKKNVGITPAEYRRKIYI